MFAPNEIELLPAMSVAAGDRLGPYEILSRIGDGGMGEVWRAKDTRLNRIVAIKLLRGEQTNHPDFHARFEREAKAISSFNHPHICTVHDFAQRTVSNFSCWSTWMERPWRQARRGRCGLKSSFVVRWMCWLR